MSEVSMNITEQMLLEKCKIVELLCKELYEYFAEIYADDADIARLWLKTALEEQNHADQFTLALKLKKGLSCTVALAPARVESVIQQLNGVLAKVKKTSPTLLDALESSIRLEQYLSDFHLSCVVLFEDDSYRQMFNAMMSSDQEHVASLMAACDRLSGRNDWAFAR